MSGVAAVLLAAGQSSRMGQLKALLPWRGSSLLEHQVSALLDGGATQVVVVLGHESERLRPLLQGRDGVAIAFNPDHLQGKTTSIKAGLRALDPGEVQSLLFLNVDQPRSVETVRSVIDAHGAGTNLITIPTYQGKGGHPTIVDVSLLDELLAIDEDSFGMKAVTQRHLAQTHRWEVDAAEILWDLNTPEDYRAAVENWQRG